MHNSSRQSSNPTSTNFAIQYTYYQQFQHHSPKKQTINPNLNLHTNTNANHNNHSYQIRKQPLSSILSKNIQQVPQQDNCSLLGSRQIKQQLNRNNRAISSQQIGVAQCNVFEKKIKLKKKSQLSYKKLYEQITNREQSNTQQKQKNDQIKNEGSEDDQMNFAQKYRMNLRRTVFNQTKLMIQSKKNKLSRNYQTLETGRSQKYQSQNQQSQKLAAKPSLQSYLVRKNSRKLSSHIDAMYKTIINNHRTVRQPPCQQLDVSKFPIIIKNKKQQNFNYSNLLNVLSMRQRSMKQHQKIAPLKKFTKNINQRSVSRGSNMEKHQIKPWETFTDQFIQ